MFWIDTRLHTYIILSQCRMIRKISIRIKKHYFDGYCYYRLRGNCEQRTKQQMKRNIRFSIEYEDEKRFLFWLNDAFYL